MDKLNNYYLKDSETELPEGIKKVKDFLQLRRNNKDRQNKFDRSDLKERIESVKKLRSASQINLNKLQSMSKIIIRTNNVLTDSHLPTEGSKSNLSKVIKN